ncbi:hypothetical protein A6A04_00975 [Paramagnetospirillum marisnigri]|uniref:Uncharacterized protein n=1 Tax=Paramagnetospirillum marisnigri TaxID=1285242 RepID=A0A178MTZ9_9PROT|nr:hypothetical protein [Paramagnetospirillum marisnigri]OAN52297.1 hypothetical protein A6A04_00975 [Paramagnetospirillum marisnigri]
MNALPQDQNLLLDDLLAKLERISDLPGMLHYMAEVLHALLRRQSDVTFLATIQDAFAAGLAGLTWNEQKSLAAEVIRVVIEKRPEIAKAWHAAEEARLAALEAEEQAPKRRESDLVPAPLPMSLHLGSVDDGPYDFAAAEERIAAHLGELVDRRLALMMVPPPQIPSVAYCHSQPFFLFDTRLGAVLKAFVKGPLLSRCRVSLERRVYVKVDQSVLTNPERAKAFWTEMRSHVWKAVDSRLEKLAQHQKSGESKLAAQQRGEGFHSEIKVVEKEVVRPKSYNIMGVSFSLGKETTTKKVKVTLPPANQLNKEEEEALAMIAELRDKASQSGVELPPAADFQFLRTLLDFNTRLFTQSRDELLGLAGHGETTTRFLRERLHQTEKNFNNLLVDILVMMMFTRHGEMKFGLSEFYAACVGAARDKSSINAKRPFIPAELARRPTQLAIQLREALRRRLHVDVVLAAAERYLDCHKIMGKKLYGAELAESRALIEAFPMVFAGNSEEATFVQVGQHILDMLDGVTPELSICLVQIGRTYDRVGRKTAAVS